MNKSLPDKWIRKAIYDALDGMTINTNLIRVYDVFITRGNNDLPDHYIIQSTQSNEVNKANKCESYWESTLLLDVVTTFFGGGNPGDRVLVDDILDEVRNRVDNLSLDVTSGLEIIDLHMSFPPDITTKTDNENVFRKFLRLELLIK